MSARVRLLATVDTLEAADPGQGEGCSNGPGPIEAMTPCAGRSMAEYPAPLAGWSGWSSRREADACRCSINLLGFEPRIAVG